MTHRDNNDIRDVLDDEFIYYREDDEYSGRGMYGATCTAFTIDRDSLRIAEGALTKADIKYCVDNMGLNYVIY